MRKKLIIILIIMIFLLFLPSCWNSRELNKLSISLGVGIDKTEVDYLLTVQLINPSDISIKTPSTRTGVTTYQIRGDTIYEALKKLTRKTPREIYLSHLQTIVFGEEFAREEGINTVLDYFSRNHELRTDFYIMVSREETAYKVLNILTSLERVPALDMYNSLEMSAKEWGSTYIIQLDELMKTLISKGKNPVLTGIDLKGNDELGRTKENVERVDPVAIVEIDGIAAFREDKLIGWLNEKESKGYNFIDDNITSTLITIHWEDGDKISIELIRSKTRLKSNIKNNQPEIDIEVISEGNVEDVESKIDMLNTRNIYVIEEKVEDVIRSDMEAAIKKAQEVFKSDIFGFGEVIRQTNPKEWKKLSDDWNNSFKDLRVNVSVDVKIRRTGTIIDSFETNWKE